MRQTTTRNALYFAGILTAALLLARVALAGPPLICHAFEIGNAKSLPWVSHNWNLSGGENYDLKNLTPDTLAILDSNAPVLVRMETLRRATLYARQDPQAARELLGRIVARAREAENAGQADALADFDAGYLIECYKQWIGRNLPHMTDGMRVDPNPAANLNGYALVKKAIALRGEDSEMEFAAALITLEGPQAAHQQHVSKAMAGANRDALLAANLKTHYLGDGMTVADVFSKQTKANP